MTSEKDTCKSSAFMAQSNLNNKKTGNNGENLVETHEDKAHGLSLTMSSMCDNSVMLGQPESPSGITG